MSRKKDKEVLSPAEVARSFGVNPKTVTRWAEDGKLPYFRTPGGQRRFHISDVRHLLGQDEPHEGEE